MIRNTVTSLFTGLGLFYTYLLTLIISISWLCFPIYYNLFHGNYKPQAKDYTPDVIQMWFFLFAPLSLLLSISSIFLIKKYTPCHKNKLFFLFAFIGAGVTCYFVTKFLLYIRQHCLAGHQNELESLRHLLIQSRLTYAERFKASSPVDWSVYSSFILGNQVMKQLLLNTCTTLGLIYSYLLVLLFSVAETFFSVYYNLFYGQYVPIPEEYVREKFEFTFFVLAPISLLLSIITICLIKKYTPSHYRKVFFLFSIIGIGITSYIIIKLVT